MLHKVRHYDLGTGINKFPTTQKGHNYDLIQKGHNSDQRRKEHSMSFLKDVYSAIVMVMKHTEAYDSDGDGMIENSGFPDQTYVCVLYIYTNNSMNVYKCVCMRMPIYIYTVCMWFACGMLL